MKTIVSRLFVFGLVAQGCMLPAADIKDSLIAALTIGQPGEYEITWPRQAAWDGSVYQVQVAGNPAGPWLPVIGPVIQWGPGDEDLKRTHRTGSSTRFFRVVMVGHSSVMPANLTPAEALEIHQGFLEDRNLAFDEAFITFHEATDLEWIEAANGLRWDRVKVLSPTEAWYRAVDGLSSGNRGQDLADQLETLNAREDVKAAYAILMYQNLRQFTAPRLVVQFKPGEPYGDLMQALGDSISFAGAVGSIPNAVFYEVTRPKETNLYELLQTFRAHGAVEAADFDGRQQVQLLNQLPPP